MRRRRLHCARLSGGEVEERDQALHRRLIVGDREASYRELEGSVSVRPDGLHGVRREGLGADLEGDLGVGPQVVGPCRQVGLPPADAITMKASPSGV